MKAHTATVLACLFAVACNSADSDEWAEFVSFVHGQLTKKQDALADRFKISTYPNYFYDQALGTIAFCEGDTPAIVAEIEVVGSVSERSGTWMWAWHNESIAPGVRERIATVREFGREHGFKKLIQPLWQGDEVDGWEMTSAAGFVLDADGAYRSPDDDGALFLLLFNTQPAEASGLRARCS